MRQAGRAGLIATLLAWPLAALSATFNLAVEGENPDIREALKSASLVRQSLTEGEPEAREIFAAALADYRNLVEALYAEGYYSSVVSIRLDGREAASIPLLSVPGRVNAVTVRVDPGPPFRFGTVQIAPRAPGSTAAPELAPGQPARGTVLKDGVETAIDDWRGIGHAKARVADERIAANHADARLSAEIALAPGPRVRFGDLVVTSPSAVRVERLKRIAGVPNGAVYSPETLEKVARRLRRTGAFSSVTLTEAADLGPSKTMDVALRVADMKPRRYGFGAEYSTVDGIGLSAFWLHRNLFGGAERFRVEGEVGGVSGQTGGIDYSLGARLEFPATFGPDTKTFVFADIEREDEPDYLSDSVTIGGGVEWLVTDELSGTAGISYSYAQTDDVFGQRTFSLLQFPITAEWDRRDNTLDPANGFFIAADVTPFLGFGDGTSGARSLVEARAYRGFGESDGVVIAGRVQVGSIIGAGLAEVPPDFLFHSGGGGTVRGQPYQSLGVGATGGRSFVGLSGELRVSVTETIGAVVFADAGYVGPESFYDGSGAWHSGAGVGLRYKTPLGPIRFDVAAPVSGGTGDGVQVYLGIGQSF